MGAEGEPGGAYVGGRHRLVGLDDPVENLVQALDHLTRRSVIPTRIIDSALQHVQTILQLVEFGSRHRQFVLRQAQLFDPLKRRPIPVAASVAAEFPWSAWARGWPGVRVVTICNGGQPAVLFPARRSLRVFSS